MLFLNHPTVRGYYLKHGHVFTLRPHCRKHEGPTALVQGGRFKHRPVGRGVVVLARQFEKLTPQGLAKYAKKSGFKKAQDWIDAYVQMNRGQLHLPAYVYEVRKLTEK